MGISFGFNGLLSFRIFDGRLRMGFWNARALFVKDKLYKRNQKIQMVRDRLHSHDIFCVQETHGIPEDVVVAFGDFSSDVEWFFNPGVNAATAGTLTFVRRS